MRRQTLPEGLRQTLNIKKGLFSCLPPHPAWCYVTSTNIILAFYCLRVSIVSVYYRYEVWQGSDCNCGTCVPSKGEHGGLLWFAGWFPVQLFPWEPVGGVLMKGLTEAAHFSLNQSGPSLCLSSHWIIWLVSGGLLTFTLRNFTLIPINISPLYRICLLMDVWWYFSLVNFAVFFSEIK